MSRRERHKRRARSKGGPSRFIFLTLGLLGTVLLLGAAGVASWVLSVASSAPDLSTLKPAKQGGVSVVFAANGEKLGYIKTNVLRTYMTATQIPDVMRNATVAVEDKRFYKHDGVDYEGIVRAAITNVTTGKTAQGGSTLEMQLIRNLYKQSSKKTMERKIREAKLAQQLEERHPGQSGKAWILSTYLNAVPYGNAANGQEVIGVGAASRVYFDKKPSQLTLPEAALLAGLPQAPSDYNPLRFKRPAKARRNDVLKRMADQKYITQAQAAEAMRAPLGVKSNSYYQKRKEAYFLDYVQAELIKKYGEQRVREGGMEVYTTIDPKLQHDARKIMRAQLPNASDPSSALVSIDPRNGHIRTMASSTSYAQSKFNLAAQGKRQPGSTFKVMVLMAAVRQGVDPNSTTYESKPLDFIDPTWGKIDVQTDDHVYPGRTTLFDGLVRSDNTVYQQLDLDIGPKNVTKTAYDMGVTSHLNSYPAEGLGGLKYGVTPLEMARAYNTINTGGYRVTPVAITKVVFPGNKIDRSLGKTHRTKMFTDGQTAEVRKAMEANIERGTGKTANIGCADAGKTGTTSDFKDAWFDGFTPNLTTAVWVGYPTAGIPMTNVPGWGTMFGGMAPAAIWHDYMQLATGDDCGSWAPVTEPFESSGFYGHYADDGAPGGGDDPEADYQDSTDTTSTDGTDTGTTNGDGSYDKQKYSGPKQDKPNVPKSPDPPPEQTVPDTGGTGDAGTGGSTTG